MNGRVYDPMLHRFLQPDNNIQSPFDTQNFNRYSYVLNNPLKYTDPTGEFAFVPVLAAMAYGALIGAAMAVVTYSFTALASGTFSWSGFGKAALMGGIGGAISAGIGAVGTQLFNASSAFIQSGTLNVLSDFTSQVGVSVAFGDPVTAGTLLGSLAGAYIGAQMGNWSGTSSGWLKNAASEIGYGALKGSIRGAVSGFTAFAVDGKDFMQGTLYGARNGAIGGAIQSGLMMAIFGPTFKPSDVSLW